MKQRFYIIFYVKVIAEYSKALDLLDDYDHKTLKKIEGNIDERRIEYNKCIEIINKLKLNEQSRLFVLKKLTFLLYNDKISYE